jgi:membrane protein
MSQSANIDSGSGRGRSAKWPWQIPWSGWKDVIWRSTREIDNDGVLDLAAGVAFWGLFALFPALVAVVSIYGLLADPADVAGQLNRFTHALPQAVRVLITQQLTEVHRGSVLGLRVGLVASLVVALFTASGGVTAVMRGINRAYDEKETRGWLRTRMRAMLFTLGVATSVVASLGVIALLPPVMDQLGLEASTRRLIQLGRWPALALATMLGVGLLYRYGPNRTPPKWSWVAAGAILATVIWALASVSLGVYADNFGRFNKTYGTLGAGAVLALWMFLSALAILMGAELNSELEHQTREDTTVGPPHPMGKRGAAVADRIGSPRPVPDDGKKVGTALRDKFAELNRPGRGKPPSPS